MTTDKPAELTNLQNAEASLRLVNEDVALLQKRLTALIERQIELKDSAKRAADVWEKRRATLPAYYSAEEVSVLHYLNNGGQIHQHFVQYAYTGAFTAGGADIEMTLQTLQRLGAVKVGFSTNALCPCALTDVGYAVIRETEPAEPKLTKNHAEVLLLYYGKGQALIPYRFRATGLHPTVLRKIELYGGLTARKRAFDPLAETEYQINPRGLELLTRLANS